MDPSADLRGEWLRLVAVYLLFREIGKGKGVYRYRIGGCACGHRSKVAPIQLLLPTRELPHLCATEMPPRGLTLEMSVVTCQAFSDSRCRLRPWQVYPKLIPGPFDASASRTGSQRSQAKLRKTPFSSILHTLIGRCRNAR